MGVTKLELEESKISVEMLKNLTNDGNNIPEQTKGEIRNLYNIVANQVMELRQEEDSLKGMAKEIQEADDIIKSSLRSLGLPENTRAEHIPNPSTVNLKRNLEATKMNYAAGVRNFNTKSDILHTVVPQIKDLKNKAGFVIDDQQQQQQGKPSQQRLR